MSGSGGGAGPGVRAVQGTLDDLGTPLRDVTFVVVDLETTGGSASASSITEVGAVKVRGGEVLGEFQTLVRPGEPIPVFIQVLTGITDAMVAQAPRIESRAARPSSSSPATACSSRTTPGSTCRSSRRRRAPPGIRGRGSGCSTPSTWPGSWS